MENDEKLFDASEPRMNFGDKTLAELLVEVFGDRAPLAFKFRGLLRIRKITRV